jgi:hypothetical protein
VEPDAKVRGCRVSDECCCEKIMDGKSSRLIWLVVALGVLGGCAQKAWQGSQNSSATGNAAPDASALLPKENVVAVKVVNKELLDKSFMPGGTVARYRRGQVEYEIFLGELPTATDSAIVLAHWDQALRNPKVVQSLDAYYGVDAGRPIYVFAKGRWVAGITGLSEKEADQQARMLAERL